MPSALMAISIGIPSYLLKDVVGLSYLILLVVIITLGLCTVLRFRFALGAVAALIHDVIITVEPSLWQTRSSPYRSSRRF